MSSFQHISHITLPEGIDAAAFVAFMKNEYFPAIYKGATNVGQVPGLALLQGVDTPSRVPRPSRSHMFFMLVGVRSRLQQFGEPVDDEEVQRKFKAFGAHVETLGVYDQVAVWPESTGV